MFNRYQPMNTSSCFAVLSLFGAISQICDADPKVRIPVKFVRAEPDFAPWAEAGDALVDLYRKDLKPTADTKVVPLFLCVRLSIPNPESIRTHIDKPDSKPGARVLEYAFMYTEARLGNGTKERKIVLFSRFPYENPKWDTEEMLNMVEGEDAQSSILVLKEAVDTEKQVSDFIKAMIYLSKKEDHLITMVAFEKGVSMAFGKNLDDKTLLEMCPRDAADPVDGK